MDSSSTADTGTDPQDTAVVDTGDCAEILGGGCGLGDLRTACVGEDPGTGPEAIPPGEIRGGGLFGCQTVDAAPSAMCLGLGLIWWVRRIAVGVLLSCGLSASAHAQVDVQRLQITDGGDFPALWEGDLGTRWSGAVTGSVNAANNLAILEGVPEADVLLDRVWTWEVSASVNLGGVTRLGLSLPYHAATFLGDRVEGLLLGDVAAWISVPVTGPDNDVQGAWTVKFDIPTGQPDLLLGDVGVVTGMVSATFPAGPMVATTNLGAAVQQDVPLPGTLWGSHWVYGIGLRAEPAGPTWVTGELLGSTPIRFWSGERAQYPTEVLLSAGAVANRFTSVGVGIGTGLSQGLGSPTLRGIALLDVRARTERDRDEDGISDLRDLCRREPEDRDGFRDNDGCPDHDNDQDGLPDRADACPNQAEVVNGHLDDDGCPDRITDLQVRLTAVDGLEQALVQVGAARPVVVFAGEDLVRRLDLDSVDVEVSALGFHPYRAEVLLVSANLVHEVVLDPVRYGVVRFEVVDPSGDPVDAQVQIGEAPTVDANEAMRHPVGEITAEIIADGFLPRTSVIQVPADSEVTVPIALVPARIQVDGARLVLGDRIRFDVDASVLDAASLAVIRDLARWLGEHREVQLLRIEGHADAAGGSRYNYELSSRRARAVRDALVDAGVAAERLDAIGTGEAQLASVDTSRRVEFVVLVWKEPDPPPPPPAPLDLP